MDKVCRSRKQRLVYPNVGYKEQSPGVNWFISQENGPSEGEEIPLQATLITQKVTNNDNCIYIERENETSEKSFIIQVEEKEQNEEETEVVEVEEDEDDLSESDPSESEENETVIACHPNVSSDENSQTEPTEILNDAVSDKDIFEQNIEDQNIIETNIENIEETSPQKSARIRRHKFEFPPTPSTISSDPDESKNINPSPFRRRDQIVRWFSQEWGSTVSVCESVRAKMKTCRTVMEPQSYLYVTWLTLVTFAYLYNCWVIPLRTTFPYQTVGNTLTWLFLDYSMDAIYLLDVAVVKPRIMYLDDGFWVYDSKKTRKNYVKKFQFKIDVLSLLPIDILYHIFKTQENLMHPLLRLPRMFKIFTFWEFFDHFDNVLSSPYVVRVARTLTYMIYLVHLNACAYYAVSVKEGLGSNSWVFNGQGNAYIRCFYFATKTATSIGKNPRPENELEYLFMTGCWLMGVFVFALLIGQIRDIIATATRSQTEYRKRVDETMDHLRRMNLPPKMLERVKTWFTFTWEQQHTLDENKILDTLPDKMKTDVAINVHINTLNKVQLFKNCDEALLRELVLKLRPVLYLPGDYICRKGEVGKEMYIVKTGKVQVVSSEENKEEVLATLTEGSVFGEISLLSLCGDNRRTADVKSPGFSNLFVLSKSDLNEALVFYPNAQEILKMKAKQLMKQNAARENNNDQVKEDEDSRFEIYENNNNNNFDFSTENKDSSLSTAMKKDILSKSKAVKFLNYESKRCNSSRTMKTNKDDVINKMKRSKSLELENLNFSASVTDIKTFQCDVTVHREMSK